MAQIETVNARQVGFQEEDYYIEQLQNRDVFIRFEIGGVQDSIILNKDSLIFISDTSNAITKEIYHSIYSKPIPLIGPRFPRAYTGDLDLYHPNGELKLHCEIRDGRLSKTRALLQDQFGYPILLLNYKGHNLNSIEYHPTSFIPIQLKDNGVEKSWYENGVMNTFYDKGNRTTQSWYKNGVMMSKIILGEGYSYWDSSGLLISCGDSKYSKRWANGVLKEYKIKDTIGFNSITYKYSTDSYEIIKSKLRINPHRWIEVKEVYTLDDLLLSIDSAVYNEGAEETTEVFEIVSERPYYPGGKDAFERAVVEWFKGDKIKKSKKGVYSIRIELNRHGRVVNVETTSTAKRSDKISKKIEIFVLGTRWQPCKRQGKGVKSKMLIDLKIK